MTPYVVPIDVRFADLDALGHVNSGAMIAYAEHCRVNWLLEAGLADSPTALPLIVASIHIDYKAPMSKKSAPEVCMWTSRIGSKSWDWEYSIRDRATAVEYAHVKTVQVAYDYSRNQSASLSEGLRRQVAELAPPPA